MPAFPELEPDVEGTELLLDDAGAEVDAVEFDVVEDEEEEDVEEDSLSF